MIFSREISAGKGRGQPREVLAERLRKLSKRGRGVSGLQAVSARVFVGIGEWGLQTLIAAKRIALAGEQRLELAAQIP